MSTGQAADFGELVAELERAATQLRSGELETAAAATLVERCADLAGNVATELERMGREAEHGAPEGQERLL